MRISTQSFYDQSLASMSSQQGGLLHVQSELGSMLKILTPSDDPLGATQALATSQSISLEAQYSASRAQANQSLGLESNALQSATTLLQNVKGLIVQAGDGTMSDSDRAAIATSLQSNYQQLLGLANTDNGNGQYLFAGFKSGSAPFVQQAGGGVQYVGDQGQQLLQVDVSRQMAGSDDGRTVFQSAGSAAGYVTTSSAGNSGTGVYGPVAVIDATNPDYGKNFSINFTSASTYTITNSDTPPVVTAGAFTAGTPIQFGGLQLSLTGTPASGDSFNVNTANDANPDMFGALQNLIGALNTPVDNGTPAAKAQLLNSLSTANVKLTNSLNNVLTVSSSVGSRMQELDTLNTNGSNRTLADQTYLSSVQDLNYTSAITELYQRRTALQATQQTFVQIRKLSLLNYI